MYAPRTILCATDFGACSKDALALAISLARTFDGAITLVHVFDSAVYAGPPFMPALDVGADAQATASVHLEAAVMEAKRHHDRVNGVLRRGRPWEEILEQASQMSADLIVLGTHGRTGLPRAIMGSVAEKVVRLSPVPVLTVPTKDRDDAPKT
jgi:nucleotide-binding universal stress UspA family protein